MFFTFSNPDIRQSEPVFGNDFTVFPYDVTVATASLGGNFRELWFRFLYKVDGDSEWIELSRSKCRTDFSTNSTYSLKDAWNSTTGHVNNLDLAFQGPLVDKNGIAITDLQPLF